MAIYRVRFVVETSLRGDKSIQLEHKGHKVVLDVSNRKLGEDKAHIQAEVEADNHEAAQLWATGELLPAVLDALAFATGTSLLLLRWDFILKKESGRRKRRAVYCDYAREIKPRWFSEGEIREAQEILMKADGPALQLFWHRYAHQRQIILDRFLFQWLAFEGLAGKRQIPTTCPHCRTEVSHCDKALTHEGSDRRNGYFLLSRTAPEISEREFSRSIWGKLRNSIFHGTAQPGPDLLSEIKALTPKLREACDLEFSKRYGLDTKKRPNHSDLHFLKYSFVEWETGKPEADFADDLPWDRLRQMVGGMAEGEIGPNIPDETGIELLDYNRETPGW